MENKRSKPNDFLVEEMANKRRKPNDCDEVNVSDDIIRMLSNLYMNTEHADVMFVVENIKIPAHKAIVSGRSSYFDSLLNGGFVEASQSEIELKVPLVAFKEILRYIYTGRLLFIGLDVSQMLDVCALADLYGFETLKCDAVEHLIANVTMTTCCEIFDGAAQYSIDALRDACFEFMERNAGSLLKEESFRTLSITSLSNLLERKTFFAPEIEIFNGLKAWLAHNRDADVKEAIKQIRWSLISAVDLTAIVFPSEILDQAELVKIIAEQKEANVKGDRFNQYDQLPRMEIDSDDDLADLGDHKSFLIEAKRLKHLADRKDNSLAKVILYMESTVQFLFAGLTMERNSTRKKKAAFTMYKDTLSLIRYTTKGLNNHQQRPGHEGRLACKLNILCLRYQSLINYRLYKLRSAEAKENYKDINCFLETNNVAVPPNLGDIPPSTSNDSLVVPKKIIWTIQHQGAFFNYLITCHEQWEKANVAIVSGDLKDWFKQLDDEIGPLTLHMPFRKSIEYVQAALRKIKQM